MRAERARLGVLWTLVVIIVVSLVNGCAEEPRTTEPEKAVTGGRIAAVGDSITFGEGVGTSKRDSDAYPAQLQKRLGSSFEVMNFGYIGATVQDAGDVPYKTTDAYTASLESDPSIVVVMLGANDSKPKNWQGADQYADQLEELIRFYRLLPTAPTVYVATPPAAFDNKVKIRGTVIAREIVPAVKNVGSKTSTSVIDVYGATKDHPEYFDDGVHPNREGAEAIAKAVQGAIT